MSERRRQQVALYHLSIDQVRRSKGQSVVASAAYRAGEVLYNEYYGEETNYTNKRGIVMAFTGMRLFHH